MALSLTDNRNAPIIQLWVIPGGMKESADLSDQVLGLKYEDNAKKADRLTLTIDNDDLRNFDEPVWRTGSTALVSWGYYGTMTPERRVVIRKVTGFLQLNVEGTGGEVTLDRIAHTKTFYDKTYSQVVSEIAARWGYSAATSLWVQETHERHAAIHQANMTDAQFIRRLANNLGWVWYITHDGFHFHPRAYMQREDKRLMYRYDPSKLDDTEIIDVSVEMDVTRVAGSMQSVGFSPAERFGIKVDATNMDDDAQANLASRVIAGGLYNMPIPGLKDVYHHEIKRAQGVQAVPAAIRKNAQVALLKAQSNVVELMLTVVGNPNIYADTVIEIDGIGQRLSQRYYVKRVTHIINRGYTTEIECVSDGVGGHSTKSRWLPEATIIRAAPLKPSFVSNQQPRKNPGIKVGDGETVPAAGSGTFVEIDPYLVYRKPQPLPTVEDAPRGDPQLALPSTTPAQDKAVIRGNIDLTRRPHVQLDTGEVATVRSMSYQEDDGLEYLVPTVSDDGRIMSNNEAIDTFRKTGKFLGAYRNPDEATAAAEEIHLDQERNQPTNTLKE